MRALPPGTPPADRWLAAVAPDQDAALAGPVRADLGSRLVEPAAPEPEPDPALMVLGRQFLEFASRLLAERKRREEATGMPWTVRLQPVRADPSGVSEVVFSLVLEPGDLQAFARKLEEARNDGHPGNGTDPS